MKRAELLKILDLSAFIAIDFETTGLSRLTDRIIEVAAILFKDGKPTDSFVTLVNPKIQIADEITTITGITNDMVSDAPTELEIVNDLHSFLGEYPLVAHNMKFDEGFLKELFDRHDLPEKSNQLYDTLHLARVAIFDQPTYNLGFLAEFFDLSSAGSHRAKKDAENCGEIFLNLVEESATYPLEVISKCVSILKGRNYFNTSLFINLADALVKRESTATGIIQSTLNRTSQNNRFEQESNDSFSFPKVKDIFGNNGKLSQIISRFEKRESQIQFIDFIDEVFQKDRTIGIVEAGTGLGKSFGYLYEAMKHVHEKDKKSPVVISCYTKSLQDQLFYKDLPVLAKTLENQVSAVKLKGRANYICLSRLNWLIGEAAGMLSDEEAAHLLPLIFWLNWTNTGDLEECSGFTNSRNFRVQKMIQSEPGFCTTQVCVKHNGCFLGKVRKNLFQTDIIIVNHALLLSDVVNPGLLPSFETLIVDEAHNLIDAAYSQFSHNMDFAFLKSSLLICQPKFSGNRRWKNSLKSLYEKVPRLKKILSDIDQSIDLAIDAVDLFFSQLSMEYKSRYSITSPYVQKIIINDLREEYRNLPGELNQVYKTLESCEKKVTQLWNTLDKYGSEKEKIEDLILSTKQKAESLSAIIHSFKFLTSNQDGEWVYWQEGNFRNSSGKNSLPEISIHASPIDVGVMLSEYLLPKTQSIILTSATLQVEHSFDYFLNRSGISRLYDVNTKFSVCPSPFLYPEQVKYHQYSGDQSLADNPMGIAEIILKCHNRLKKKILVLFTSYSSLSKVTQCLRTSEGGRDLPIFSQTQASSRYGLLKGMANSENGILMGTSSFWEGIDLSGDMLEILIIAKLPFQVPSDPIVKAYGDKLAEKNMNSFMNFTVPECVLKYRQGFGRLIRTSYDEGVFIVLDNRIVIQRYGRQFRDAIPVEMQMFSTLDSLIL
jgi:predicted DnaQ family exonuclease/DinG family helicase